MKKRAVIFLNGEYKDYNFYKCNMDRDDFCICADNGLVHALRAEISPHLLIGDFDSITDEQKYGYIKDQTEIIRLSPEKDMTDGEAAIDAAIERGYKEIVLFGALGGRVDQIMGNIGLIYKAYLKGVRAYLSCEEAEVHISKGIFKVGFNRFKYLSILPVLEKAGPITLEGMKYPLDRAVIQKGSTLGISNEITSEKAVINSENSIIYIIFQN